MSLTTDELLQRARDAAFQVSTARDRSDEPEVVAAAHRAALEIAEQYRQFYQGLDDAGRMKVDRTLGRRVQDIRRQASLLPRVAGIMDSTPDRHPADPGKVEPRRVTGLSGSGVPSLSGPPSALRVGGEIESWCGPCGGMTDHNIVAMVSGEPRQVLCQTCGGRHRYRTTPARKAPADNAGAERAEAKQPPSAEQRKKAEAARALAAELQEAKDIPLFDPKERYRAGDFIYHPEFGEGKIENAFRSSVLVRFAQGGLKSLMLR